MKILDTLVAPIYEGRTRGNVLQISMDELKGLHALFDDILKLDDVPPENNFIIQFEDYTAASQPVIRVIF